MEASVESIQKRNKNLDKKKNKKITLKKLKEQKFLILMSFPFVVWVIIFCYVPLAGWVMAFEDYMPGQSFFKQHWSGLKQFKMLFHDDQFYQTLVNTLGMSSLGLIFGFTIPIIFALLLNELRSIRFKRTVQTISYLPHFVSWVIASSIIIKMLSVDGGVVNIILMHLHLISKPLNFMAKPNMFWGIVTASDVWKETGWNAIIYLAAITGIDQELYEAAKVDGANRFKQMIHITLPGIRPTIMVLLIMSIGNIINIGFEKQFLLGNNIVKDKGYVIDWYALDYGIGLFRYSYGTAIGIFKSVVSIVLLFAANQFARRTGEGAII
ncbi:ABC transporter permease [Clostridium oryzae]|uniref:Putative multiple-sugar transport system permease YteP n=1 Tax=Clostridium oryzae TaxID=1450648 RepID=A0A1V4IZ01_9CLOT|nr:ABC transporter permease subunit [Clostridium oryzae]OPJ65123.1 putative multiple-sugar transport system permease YteP [Clostridium oryzae]